MPMLEKDQDLGARASVAEEDVTPQKGMKPHSKPRATGSSDSRLGIGYIFPWVLLSQDFMSPRILL